MKIYFATWRPGVDATHRRVAGSRVLGRIFDNLVLADGDLIDLQHFPSLTREASESLRGGAPLAPLGLRLEELERWYVLETLRRMDGNRTTTARQLGISLRGLQYKLRRYGTNGHGTNGHGTNGHDLDRAPFSAIRPGLEPPVGRGGFATMSQLNDRTGLPTKR